jgi:two-component system, chemotaxis family, chemotaxis protein CheY
MVKILIVDDSATMRKIILRALRLADVVVDSVLEASDGVEGLQRLLSDPDICLILSDVNMPNMNGLEFVKAVRKTRAKETLPIIMVTTEGSDAVVSVLVSSGANACLKKPFTPSSLRQALDGFLA